MADKAIPAVIIRSIDTEQADIPVSAIVERNIYSEVGRKIIIPAGSRLIGEIEGAGAGEDVGTATKVGIKWTRLIRPDGAAFSFEDGVSGDASGRAGVGAYMDRQLIKRYGLPLMQSSITSAFLWSMASNDAAEVGEGGEVAMTGRQQAAEDARSRFSDTMQQIFDDIMSETSKIKTRLFVPSGTRVTVFAKKDLWLRSEVEDEEEDLGLLGGSQAGVLIDPNKKYDKEGRSDSGGAGGGVEQGQEGGSASGNSNDANMQQQQQIYYNNYAGQQPQADPNREQRQQQQQLQQQQLRQQIEAAQKEATQQKEDEAIPELF